MLKYELKKKLGIHFSYLAPLFLERCTTALILFFSKVETISCHLPESNIWRYEGTLTNIEDTAQIVKKTSYNIYSEKSYKGGDAIYE